MRARLVASLAPFATEAHREISGIDELLELEFAPGNEEVTSPLTWPAHVRRNSGCDRRLSDRIATMSFCA